MSILWKAAGLALALAQASSASATNFINEIEPNNLPSTAQMLQVSPVYTPEYTFISGIVEGTTDGLKDYFAFDLAPAATAYFNIYVASYDQSRPRVQVSFPDGSTLVYFSDIYSQTLTTAGRYFIGVGRDTGSLTNAYTLGLRITAVPEPATWALLIAGFAMIGYALRKRRVSVALAPTA